MATCPEVSGWRFEKRLWTVVSQRLTDRSEWEAGLIWRSE